MRLSIIVPVYNNSQDLSECIAAIKASAPHDSEIIVVDDASTDDTAFTAMTMGVRVLKLATNSGPAAARNYGARNAQGDILFFVDSDVALAAQAFSRVEKVFQHEPDLAAVFGSYDARPKATGVISQYRNLLHHFTHQNGNPRASTFWAGCGAIRRSVFEAIGGFDEKRFPRPSIEDIELGYRLRSAGYCILLDKSIQGKHLKRWSLFSLIRTDILCRAVPWARLILEIGRVPADLNLKWEQKASAALMGLVGASLSLSLFWPAFVALAAAAVLAILFLNFRLYAFFFRRKGLPFVFACISLHLLYFLYNGISYLYVWMNFKFKRAASVWNCVRPKGGEAAH
jgi:glycosyltransferase involved in cell wall biosynthesis